ncbi:MAG: luciferase family protein [Myxococcota bacterium]
MRYRINGWCIATHRAAAGSTYVPVVGARSSLRVPLWGVVALAGVVALGCHAEGERARAHPSVPRPEGVVMPTESLPHRAGPRPRTTDTNPHTQLDQNAPEALQQQVAAFMFGLACVREIPSQISVPGARAMWLHESCAAGPANAFMIGREFCHLHPASDGSLHLNLPEDILDEAIAHGWAEPHPLAARGIVPRNVVMVYGPRDDAELEIVKRLVAASHAFAHAG